MPATNEVIIKKTLNHQSVWQRNKSSYVNNHFYSFFFFPEQVPHCVKAFAPCEWSRQVTCCTLISPGVVVGYYAIRTEGKASLCLLCIASNEAQCLYLHLYIYTVCLHTYFVCVSVCAQNVQILPCKHSALLFLPL